MDGTVEAVLELSGGTYYKVRLIDGNVVTVPASRVSVRQRTP